MEVTEVKLSLTELYKAILGSMYCTVDDEDMIGFVNTKKHFKINDKTVVLPTMKYLSNPEWNKYFPFHPLSEDPILGQSEVIHFLLKRVCAAIVFRVTTLIEAMLLIASKPELQQRITDPKYAAHLECVGMAKESTLTSFLKVVKAFTKEGKLISVYVTRETAGRTYRTATLHSPLFECTDDTAEVFGLKLSSKTDKQMIVSALNYVLPESIRQIGVFGHTPYFEGLITLYHKVISHTNEIVKPFKDLSGEFPGLIEINLNWFDFVKDNKLEHYIGVILPLDGNIGTEPLDSTINSMELMGRDSISVKDAPPWDDNPIKRHDTPAKTILAVEPKAITEDGVDVSSIFARHDDDEYDRRDRDRDRDREYDRRDRDRERDYDRRDRRDDRYSRVGFSDRRDRDYDRRDRDREYDRRDRDYDRRDRERDYDRRDRDYERSSDGTNVDSIFGGRSRR
jgi:hypothetical protein